MGYLITVSAQGNITDLYHSDAGNAPADAISISDAQGEELRKGFTGYKYVAGKLKAPDPVQEAKVVKNRMIEEARDAAVAADVSALGYMWQADDRSVKLLNGAITLAANGGPLPTSWRTADNLNLPIVALSDLLAIAGAIAVQTQAAYERSWTLKSSVEAATTITQVEAITW